MPGASSESNRKAALSPTRHDNPALQSKWRGDGVQNHCRHVGAVRCVACTPPYSLPAGLRGERSFPTRKPSVGDGTPRGLGCLRLLTWRHGAVQEVSFSGRLESFPGDWGEPRGYLADSARTPPSAPALNLYVIHPGPLALVPTRGAGYKSTMEWPCPTWGCRGFVFIESAPLHNDLGRCEQAPGRQARICGREMRWHEARQRWEPFGDIRFQ
jgi:hypothetical protein